MTRKEFFKILEKMRACEPGVAAARRTTGRVSTIAARWAKVCKKNDNDYSGTRSDNVGDFFSWLRYRMELDPGWLKSDYKMTKKEYAAMKQVVARAKLAVGMDY